MKRKIINLAVCAMIVSAAVSNVFADAGGLSGCAVANGSVCALETLELTAPYSGTLVPFDLERGDSVQAEDTLFTLRTTSVTAPESGTVTAVFATNGDSADNAVRRYGSILAYKPEIRQRLRCTYSGAYDDEETKLVHIGETLYFRSNKSDKEKGTATVISVSENMYVAEITSGSFEQNESLNLYRDADRSAKQKVGSARVMNRVDETVIASGRIASMNYAAGEAFEAGDVLFTLMSPDADAGAVPEVKAGAVGVVESVVVSSGQQVWKGQLLARIALTDQLVVAADVDEVDLGDLVPGSPVYVTLDTEPDTVLNGTVSEISAYGITKQNAAYFTVKASVQADGLRLGQSASMYIPKAG